jgi:hypothetical protein
MGDTPGTGTAGTNTGYAKSTASLDPKVADLMDEHGLDEEQARRVAQIISESISGLNFQEAPVADSAWTQKIVEKATEMGNKAESEMGGKIKGMIPKMPGMPSAPAAAEDEPTSALEADTSLKADMPLLLG